MDIADLKICANCVYGLMNRQVASNRFGSTYQINAFCMREVTYEIDLVSGETIRVIGEPLDCTEQRAEVSHVPNRCGVEGKFFRDKKYE